MHNRTYPRPAFERGLKLPSGVGSVISRPAPRFLPGHLGLATALLLCLALVPHPAAAAAWTRPQGNALLSLPVTYTWAKKGFDQDGNRVDRLDFKEVEVAPYFEYGITDSLTFGTQPKFRSVEVGTAGGGTEKNSGLPETDVFLRQNLWRDSDAAFSAQGLVKIPVDPQENDPAPLGRDQTDAELSLLYGNRVRGDSGTFFYNLGIGYRKRWDGLDDQAKANAFAGWATRKWTFLMTSDNTVGLESAKKDGQGIEVLTAGRSFTQLEAGLVASYHVNDTLSISANGSKTYYGENVGAKNSVGLSASMVW